MIDDKNKEGLKTLLTEYKDYFLEIQKNEKPPVENVSVKKPAPKFKEAWLPYPSTE